MSELVSILIPCYNAERWIAQAIDSALAQTWSAKEIVVVDDGSTDRSLDVIEQYDGRVLWESGPNRGGNVARNRLLELTSGEWVQYLDADDWLMPEKIASQMRFLEANPQTDIVYSQVLEEMWARDECALLDNPIPGSDPNDDIWVLLLRWWLPQTGGQLWRRQALMDVGGWNPDQPCCQDNELYLRLLIKGKRFAYCPTASAVHRLWSGDTVSRRDPVCFRGYRLGVLQTAEDFLRQSEQLTERRLQALNQTRFEIARVAWTEHREAALEIVQGIRNSHPCFRPCGPTAPTIYRLIYRLLGFHLAEIVAALRRRMSAFVGA
jgi:glycosyltransferase involved in cell wall biosynthesis